MTKDDIVFCFSVDYCDFFIEKFGFQEYSYFTFTEDYYIDKHCSYVGDWGCFSLKSSYHIPIYKFDDKENKECTFYFKSLFYLLNDGLIPDGLPAPSALTYKFLLELYTLNLDICEIDQWSDLVCCEQEVSERYLGRIEPRIQNYLLEKARMEDCSSTPTQIEEPTRKYLN